MECPQCGSKNVNLFQYDCVSRCSDYDCNSCNYSWWVKHSFLENVDFKKLYYNRKKKERKE